MFIVLIRLQDSNYFATAKCFNKTLTKKRTTLSGGSLNKLLTK